MAATVSSSVWGSKSKPGAWALEAEEHEEELRREVESAAARFEPPSADFPTLSAAAATKTKKKKPQTLSLAEFSTYSSSAPKAAGSQRLTADELLSLPTGPRERSAEDLERSRGGFGGGFRNYGYDGANSRARVSERGAGSRDRSADEGFSRADEVDDWSKSKRYVGSNGAGGDRREKVGFFNTSRADEVDNWASNKSFTPSEGRMGRRMGSDSFSSGGADSDSWGRKEERDSFASASVGQRRGMGFESSGASAADSDNWLKKKEQNPVAVGGRPKLNLQPRTLPISNGVQEVKPKGSNPFGDARPREEVLKEKGKDWKEIDEKLETLKVKEGAGDGAAGSRRFGNFKDDLMESRSWRKWETQNAPPASADNGEKDDAEKAEEVAAEKTENGDAENN